ncbi:SpoIIE family protein phosphatase [Streptomyces sp. NBC_00691]|uniref:SpoIIE family protein phosphatase n=1 Tax=Streptomyces sp. NBC_00691 TaxID=2903671 RepID=UPI002E2FFBA8|nr:SpoIIE family protein phosphatase [Streptomyces sp. NBC_00691]
MNRFARLAARLLSAPQGMVWLNPAGQTPDVTSECWPAELPVAPSVRDWCARVVELGEPVFLPVSGDGGVPFAFAGVPLVGSEGEPLGVLAVVDVVPHAWSAGEERDLMDLASACSAQIRTRARSGVARQASENAQHAADTAEDEAMRVQRLLDRSQLLLRVSEDLADTSGLDDVRRKVGDLVRGDLKPSYIGLVLLRQGMLHRVPDPIAGDSPLEDVPTPYPVDTSWPSAASVRENRMVVINDRAELTAAYGPEAVAGFDSLGLLVAVFLPLRGAHGVLGTLILAWDSPQPIDVAERAVLTTIAAYTAQAVERAVHLDERVIVAHELQQAMLTDLPAVTGLELAALYQPAAQDDMVGGDWYDAYPLPVVSDECDTPALAITVGDITGHDMKAAALMGQVRSMLRQADHDHPGMGPDHVLSALEAACGCLGIPASGTLVHAHLTPADNGHWHLTWTNAGHLPPLLTLPDGTAHQLTPHDQLMHPQLPPRPRTSHSRLLPPGSVLFLYTDGLVEKRHEDTEENVERLARLLTTAPVGVPLDTLLRSLRDAAAPAPTEDDVAMLAVRVPARDDTASR